MTRTINRNDAFTGLEAAIVLIAFVVVAAVFAYVVLGAGFFTTQKSQEVVHSGVSQASTNIEIAGEVYGLRADVFGTADNATTSVTTGYGGLSRVNFTMALAAGGTPVDMTRVSITYQNSSFMDRLTRDPSTYMVSGPIGVQSWAIVQKINADSDNILERGEMFMITARLYAYPAPNNHLIIARDDFNLEVKPDQGAALGISRTAPASLDQVNKLY